MDKEKEKTSTLVLRVTEGLGRLVLGREATRIFSVVLNQIAEDLEIVATAQDPQTHLTIPAPGSPHPEDPSLVARPPMIFRVGIREGMALLARESCFYNLRVRYIPQTIENSSDELSVTGA